VVCDVRGLIWIRWKNGFVGWLLVSLEACCIVRLCEGDSSLVEVEQTNERRNERSGNDRCVKAGGCSGCWYITGRTCGVPSSFSRSLSLFLSVWLEEQNERGNYEMVLEEAWKMTLARPMGTGNPC